MVEVRRWWRIYRTTTGTVPVREFLAELDAVDREAIRAAMRQVQAHGRTLARDLVSGQQNLPTDGR